MRSLSATRVKGFRFKAAFGCAALAALPLAACATATMVSGRRCYAQGPAPLPAGGSALFAQIGGVEGDAPTQNAHRRPPQYLRALCTHTDGVGTR